VQDAWLGKLPPAVGALFGGLPSLHHGRRAGPADRPKSAGPAPVAEADDVLHVIGKLRSISARCGK
jgi:hypothetical protein